MGERGPMGFGDEDMQVPLYVGDSHPVVSGDTTPYSESSVDDYPERVEITGAARSYLEAETVDAAMDISIGLHAGLRGIFRGPQQEEFEIRGCRQAIVAAVRCCMDIEVMAQVLPLMRNGQSLVPVGTSSMSPSFYSDQELPRHIYPEPYHTFMCASGSWLVSGAQQLFDMMETGEHPHAQLLPVLAAEFARFRDDFDRERFPHSSEEVKDGWLTGLRGNAEIIMNVLEARKIAFIERFGSAYPDLSELLVKATLRDADMLAWPNTVDMHKLDTMLPPLRAWISEEDRGKPPRLLVNPFEDSAGALKEIGDSPQMAQALWTHLRGPKKRQRFCHGNIDLSPVMLENKLLVDEFFAAAGARGECNIPRVRSGKFNPTLFGLVLGAYIAGDTTHR